MCGIFGSFSQKPYKDNQFKNKLKTAIDHRGPDEANEYCHGPFFFGANRLSIVDVDNGSQPMVREINGNRYIIVYNGELFNANEVKSSLSNQGLIPKTKCDTELVLLAYVAFGKSCVDRFNGQFSLAILDEANEEIFLARDIFGIKPLFYTTVDKAFAFASEAKALLQFPVIKKAPNHEAICEYFLHGYAFASGYVTGENSFFKGIKALPPAHRMIVSSAGMQIEKYWDIPLDDEVRSVDDFADEFRSIFDNAIGNYISDEVPVGTALSGGLDSSIITALAAKEMTGLGKVLTVRSIRYDGQAFNDDFDNAELLAKYLSSIDYSIDFGPSILTPENYLNDLDRMIYHFDEPHWEIKQLAMFNNYKALKEAGAKVVLTGEGADELFLGYYQKFPGFKNPRLTSVDEFSSLWQQRISVVNNLFTPEFAASQATTMKGLIDGALNRYYAPYAAVNTDPNKNMQCWYSHTFLHWLLTVNDRCSAAFSLEGRFPFLDRKVAELAFKVPSALNIDDELEKKILRRAFEDILPAQIAQRKKAPLPSAIDLNFHRKIQEEFALNIQIASKDFWEIFSKSRLEQMNLEFLEKIDKLEAAGCRTTGGTALTEYIYLNQSVELRTTHVFSMLTTFRWWDINFGGGFNG
jgi:asparagine synthase (glutamine-hydrolysing)